jgi:hypothetical protein
MSVVQGGTMVYMEKRFPQIRFLGVEVDSQLVSFGNQWSTKVKENARIIELDLYEIDAHVVERFNQVDGVMGLHTLSWLPDIEEPLSRVLLFRPAWMAYSSLLYDGPISYQIEVYDHSFQGGS